MAGALLAAALGLVTGVSAYTFVYAKGYSYLTNDAAACSNCHVMSEHYSGWLKSSHRSAAVCNDCHTPPGIVAKYVTKASNGFWHSFAFTSGRFPDPIRIKAHNRDVTEAACRKCHSEITDAIDHGAGRPASLSCIRCHGSVGHL
jgi:cytochrome c nitrite reductase small subunit